MKPEGKSIIELSQLKSEDLLVPILHILILQLKPELPESILKKQESEKELMTR
jgi:hypothetical protein